MILTGWWFGLVNIHCYWERKMQIRLTLAQLNRVIELLEKSQNEATDISLIKYLKGHQPVELDEIPF
jgi:hypothetical protein